ncbi:hypothetical protein [Marinobacterium sp. BA1]
MTRNRVTLAHPEQSLVLTVKARGTEVALPTSSARGTTSLQWIAM